PALPRLGARSAARLPHRHLVSVQGAGRGHRLRLPRGGPRGALAPRGAPGREDPPLPPVPADAVERDAARLLRDPGTVRGCLPGHPDLRGERPRPVQGRRHHARRAQLRPLPAVRRAPVPRQRQGPPAASLACLRHPAALEQKDMSISAGIAGEAADRGGDIESLIGALEALPDPAARATAMEAIQAVLELHGAALSRMLELVTGQAGEQGDALLAALAGDDRVGNVLILHGLHPVDTATRVRQALDEVRPYLASHGGNVELVGVADGVVRLRLEGSCKGCPSSAATRRPAIETAIATDAPDVLEVTAEGVTPSHQRPGAGLVPRPLTRAA